MAEIHHTIRANLYDNPLTENTNDFIARVDIDRSLSVREICETATSRGGAPTTADEMELNTNLFFREMAYQLCDGNGINTGYFTAYPQIKGAFRDPNEQFDPENHKLLFQFTQADLMREELENTEVKVEGVADVSTSIEKVVDVRSNSQNDKLTPNRVLRITGNKIKIAGWDPSNGVTCINTATEERTKVDDADIVENMPSELLVMIPNLPAGTYQVEVVTQYTAGTLLTNPRTSLFERILTVE